MRAVGLVLGLLTLVLPGASHAQVAVATAPAPAEPDPPSIFHNGYQGLLAGAGIGLAGGYLVARKDDFEKDDNDWRKVGLGIGIGALAGAGFGITLGIADRAGAPGARYIARDLALGVGFGFVLGAISGGIAAIVKNEAEHVMFGASIGVISGAGLGIITGIIEGQSKRRRSSETTTAVSARLRVRPSLDLANGPLGTRTVLPGLIGHF